MKTREVFDYSLLRRRIQKTTLTQENFARLLGITPSALCNRLNNKTDFTKKEIINARKILGLKKSEIAKYFFTQKVQKDEL